MKKRILLLAGLLPLLVLAACAPIRCPCDQVAVPVSQDTWECFAVSTIERESGEEVPTEFYEQCVAATEEPPAPAIWLADVCEPNDGFSSDGNMTLDSDAAGSTLYVGPSMTGPWTALGVSGPPWVVSKTALEAAGVQVGAASLDGVWLKAGDGGYPANLGAMIINREARMDAICGS